MVLPANPASALEVTRMFGNLDEAAIMRYG